MRVRVPSAAPKGKNEQGREKKFMGTLCMLDVPCEALCDCWDFRQGFVPMQMCQVRKGIGFEDTRLKGDRDGKEKKNPECV